MSRKPGWPQDGPNPGNGTAEFRVGGSMRSSDGPGGREGFDRAAEGDRGKSNAREARRCLAEREGFAVAGEGFPGGVERLGVVAGTRVDRQTPESATGAVSETSVARPLAGGAGACRQLILLPRAGGARLGGDGGLVPARGDGNETLGGSIR